MNRVEKIYLGILSGIGWIILCAVLLAAGFVILPLIIIVTLIVIIYAYIDLLISKYKKRKFLRPYRGKTILFCTGGKFYQKFAGRNNMQLHTMVDEVIYIDQYMKRKYKETNWLTFIDTQKGFPIIMKVERKVKTQNLKKDFFQQGRKADDNYFIEVLNTHVNKLNAGKKVL